VIAAEVEPLTEFFDAIKSPLTKDRYEKRIDLFFRYLKIEGSDVKARARSFARKAKTDNDWATQAINDYMRTQKARAEKKEISESTVPNYYKPIKLFCEMNDITLNWKKIAKRIPRGQRYGKDRAPTVDEVKAILEYPDRRIRPVVLTSISCGLRNGAWDYLQWKHITPIDRQGRLLAAKIVIYAGTNEEYTSFISPEAYNSLLEYMNYRTSSGERVTGESAVMRDLFVPDRGGRGEPHLPKRLKSSGVKRMMEDALKGTGQWKPLQNGQKRHEFQANHGFRKFFKSVCEKHMKTLHVEMLMGHDVGLAENYYRPSQQELISEYLKAVPDLTITESAKRKSELERKVVVSDKKVGELERENQGLKDRLTKIERDFIELRAMVRPDS
jgi:integrase